MVVKILLKFPCTTSVTKSSFVWYLEKVTQGMVSTALRFNYFYLDSAKIYIVCNNAGYVWIKQALKGSSTYLSCLNYFVSFTLLQISQQPSEVSFLYSPYTQMIYFGRAQWQHQIAMGNSRRRNSFTVTMPRNIILLDFSYFSLT